MFATRRRLLRGSVASLLAVAAAGCGGGSGSASPSSTGQGAVGATPTDASLLGSTSGTPRAVGPPSIAPAVEVTGALLTHAWPVDLASIRAAPSTFAAHYETVGASGPGSAGDAIRASLGPAFATLSDVGCAVVYAASLACRLAPIGTTSVDPMNGTLTQLLRAPGLACGHFCKLTLMLAMYAYPTLVPPDAADPNPAKPTVHVLVWLKSAPLNVGFHAQLVVTNVLDGGYLLVDPMHGLIMAVPGDASHPDPALSAIENVALLLTTPAADGSIVSVSAPATRDGLTVAPALAGGALGPDFVYHDSFYGSEGWDTRMGQIVVGVG